MGFVSEAGAQQRRGSGAREPALDPESVDATSSGTRHWSDLLVVLGGSVALGVVLGVVWSLVAPSATISVQDGQVFLGEDASSVLIADDGWFFALAVVAGVIAAVASALVWTRRRRPDGGLPWGLLAGLVVGGALGSVAAAWTGHWLGPAPVPSQLLTTGGAGTVVTPVSVRATGVLLVWPISALVMVFAFAAGSDPRSGRLAVPATRWSATAVRSERPSPQ